MMEASSIGEPPGHLQDRCNPGTIVSRPPRLPPPVPWPPEGTYAPSELVTIHPTGVNIPIVGNVRLNALFHGDSRRGSRNWRACWEGPAPPAPSRAYPEPSDRCRP